MNGTKDPIFDALDRLARVVDAHPVDDPMPGIARKARANRRRATALAVGCIAVVVVGAAGITSAVDLRSDRAPKPAYVDSPSPSPPVEPDLADYDRARADVDGDGAPDLARVLVPKADARTGQEGILVSKDVRLRVELAAGDTVELRFGRELAPRISGTPDLDDNGTADIVLSYSGGDAGWLRVFTWDHDSMVRAKPAAGSRADLVDHGGLYLAPGVASAALVDGGLISWVDTGDTSAPYQVRVWAWQLDGTRLVAVRAEQPQCMSPGHLPEPC